MRAPDIVRVAADRYNNLSEQEKAPYIERFEELKNRFDMQQRMMGGAQPIVRRRGKARGKHTYNLH